MREFKVVPIHVGCWSGTLDESHLSRVLNHEASQGWTFERSISEKRRVWLFFQRQAHFLVFSRERSQQGRPQGQEAQSEQPASFQTQ